MTMADTSASLTTNALSSLFYMERTSQIKCPNFIEIKPNLPLLSQQVAGLVTLFYSVGHIYPVMEGRDDKEMLSQGAVLMLGTGFRLHITVGCSWGRLL